MKNSRKFTGISFVILALILFVGCDITHTDNPSSSADLSNTESYEAAVGDVPLMPTCGEVPLMTIENYREYQRLEKDTLPKEVVKYEDIKAIGQFNSFVVLSDGFSGDYSQYMYSVKDGSGYTFYITITDTARWQSKEPNILSTEYDKTDMRTVDETKSGSIFVNNIDYLYVKGVLLSISWKQGDIEFKITGDSPSKIYSLDNYPKGYRTFVSDILNSETARKTIDDLMNREG